MLHGIFNNKSQPCAAPFFQHQTGLKHWLQKGLASKHSSQPCHESRCAKRSPSTDRYPGSVFIITVKPHVHHRFPTPKDLCIYTASSCSLLYRACSERLARPRRSPSQTDKVSPTRRKMPEQCGLADVVQCTQCSFWVIPPSPRKRNCFATVSLFPARQLDVPYTSVKFFAGKD